MEYLFSTVVASAFIVFAGLLLLFVKTTLPKIENDDWEERYIKMREDEKRLANLQKYDYEQDLVD